MALTSYTLGLLFILLVSLIWAAASVLVQWIYSDQFDFDSPFLLTYIGVSLFAFFLPADWIINRRMGSERAPETAVHYAGIQGSIDELEDSSDATASSSARLWTKEDHMRAALKIAFPWFISNYAYNASLAYTSITSSTILASTGSLFTFLFAILAGDEHFSIMKLSGVALGMAGSILTGLHDIGGKEEAPDQSQNNLLWGDFLGLISAVGYGAYATLVRILCPRDESLMSMQLFLGYVGLWNMVVLSPIAAYQGIFQSSGLTTFVLGCLIVKGLFDNVLSDYLWARAVVLTSATVATVGLGLTIPLAFASDVVLGRPNVLDLTSIVGAVSVLAGFVLVNMGQQKENEEESADSNVPVSGQHYCHDSLGEGLEFSDEASLTRGRLCSPMSMVEYQDEPVDA